MSFMAAAVYLTSSGGGRTTSPLCLDRKPSRTKKLQLFQPTHDSMQANPHQTRCPFSWSTALMIEPQTFLDLSQYTTLE